MDVVEKPFKILSIDGGGIRGIYPARFLAELEEDINNAGLPKKLFEYFDLICGTSTGGIIALGIALGMSAQEVLSIYRDNADKIFPGRSSMIHYFRRPKYRSDHLSELLKNSFQSLSENGDTRLGHAKTRLCIPTFNVRNGEAHIYKTPSSPEFNSGLPNTCS